MIEPKPGFFVVSSVIGRGKYEGIKTGRAVLIKTKEKLALELWREWFAGEAGPSYADGNGDNLCFFCRAWLDIGDSPHAPDCIYIRAKELIGE